MRGRAEAGEWRNGSGAVGTASSSPPRHAAASRAAPQLAHHSRAGHTPAAPHAQACNSPGSQCVGVCQGPRPRRHDADGVFCAWHGRAANHSASAPRAAELPALYGGAVTAYRPDPTVAGCLCSRQGFWNGPPSPVPGSSRPRAEGLDRAKSHSRGHGRSRLSLSAAAGSARSVLSICVCIWWLCFCGSSAQPTITSVSPQNSPAVGGGAYVPLVLEGTGF